MANFTIGCDPEVFVKRNGKPASAYGLIPGSKESPHKTEKGAVQVDGMALELNTDPVDVYDYDGFNAAIIRQIRALRDMIPDNYNLSIAPIQDFGKELLDEQPDEAKELGCDPDWSAYTLAHNPRPEADDVTFRTGAGHIHIGWGADIPAENEEHIEICAGFVKALDVYVGLFMTFLDREPRRRELYGKAGAFRPKSYGVEYRTPSNVWIRNRQTRNFVQSLVNDAIRYHQAGRDPSHFYLGLTQDEVQRIINEGDHEKAKAVFDCMYPYNNDWKQIRDKTDKLYTNV